MEPIEKTLKLDILNTDETLEKNHAICNMNKYEMYDPKTDKLKKVSNLYGRQAKAIYKKYMNILGWDRKRSYLWG